MKPKKLVSSEFINTHKNRLTYHKIANKKIAHAKRYHHKVGLLLINLDNFQSINNHHGHRVGDKLLLKTHKRLANCLSKDDFITRIDGDEFIILLGNIAHRKIADNIALQLINRINTIHHLEGINIRINASIGIACYPHAGIDSYTLLQSATISLSHAKEFGGNNFQHYTKKLCEQFKKKSCLENALKFALEKNEFHLMYQPIFNLLTKKMVGVEALLRWRHKSLGLISPEIFIELAEKNGLIASISKWALQTVCEQANNWYQTGNHFKISFNVSSIQLLQKFFPQFIIRMFQNTHQLLDLELTETAFVTHSTHTESILKKIARAGIGITIDDFGTGHSSLTRLRNLPIRALKIDKSFVSGVKADSFDAIIIHSLINLGKKLGLNVIAEGIETKKELEFLIAKGCPQGQGYYLCKPLNAKQMTSFLKKHNHNK